MTTRTMLAINAGSSNVKCALFTFEAEPQSLVRDTIQAVGPSGVPRLRAWMDAHAQDESLSAIGSCTAERCMATRS